MRGVLTFPSLSPAYAPGQTDTQIRQKLYTMRFAGGQNDVTVIPLWRKPMLTCAIVVTDLGGFVQLVEHP